MNRKVSEEGPVREYIKEFQTISSNLEWDEGAKVDLEEARRKNCALTVENRDIKQHM